MKNQLLKKLTTIAFLTGLSVLGFPLTSQAESECESGSCGNPSPIPTNSVPGNKVTMELMLSVDVSGSINSTEYNLQKQGYIDAFRNSNVQQAIELLPHGLAVAIQTWSTGINKTSQWYKITTAAEAADFANEIESTLNQSSGNGATNVTKALRSAALELITNPYDGDVLIIDISGDGFDNMAINGSGNRCGYFTGTPINQVACPPLQAMRDNIVNNGIIINGLPIVSNFPQTDRQHELATYYENNVIGGVSPKTGSTITEDGNPVSFMQVAQDFPNFRDAVATKIEQEILISITIVPPTTSTSANNNPFVINDVGSTNGGSVTVQVLENDVDPDGDSLSISSVSNAANGTVSISPDSQTVTYQPSSNFSGLDTFTYTAIDGNGGSGTATVSVYVGTEPPIPSETDVQGHPPD
ncbi:MAG: DUF1194 domain-containing protein [Xenococcaceae cyanobacterium]